MKVITYYLNESIDSPRETKIVQGLIKISRTEDCLYTNDGPLYNSKGKLVRPSELISFESIVLKPMSFQIHDSNNQPIPMNNLDAEAAAFWGKEVHPTKYAEPSEPKKENEDEVSYYMRTMANWFDVIGYNIHSQYSWCSGWANVVANMLNSIHMHFIDTSEGYKDRPVKVAEFVKYTNNKDSDEPTHVMHLDDTLETKIYATLMFYKPYIALINHWQSKGYKPVQVNN